MPPIRNPSDRILVAQLSGRAIHLARDKGSIAEAIADLRERAGGRSDLLAETAGLMGGYWSATSATQSGDLRGGVRVAHHGRRRLQHDRRVGGGRAEAARDTDARV